MDNKDLLELVKQSPTSYLQKEFPFRPDIELLLREGAEQNPMKYQIPYVSPVPQSSVFMPEIRMNIPNTGYLSQISNKENPNFTIQTFLNEILPRLMESTKNPEAKGTIRKYIEDLIGKEGKEVGKYYVASNIGNMARPEESIFHKIYRTLGNMGGKEGAITPFNPLNDLINLILNKGKSVTPPEQKQMTPVDQLLNDLGIGTPYSGKEI